MKYNGKKKLRSGNKQGLWEKKKRKTKLKIKLKVNEWGFTVMSEFKKVGITRKDVTAYLKPAQNHTA